MGYSLAKTRIHAGHWEGVVTASGPGDEAPDIRVTHLGAELDGTSIAPDGPARWTLRIAIPADVLADGVQVFVITEAATGDKLGQFTLVTGEPLDDDIRAEVELLRAELDMLKRAFRRHCLETA